jgi:transposase
MMEGADHGRLNDPTLVEALHRSRVRGVLGEGEVGPGTVVEGEVRVQQAVEVGFVHHHEVSGAGELAELGDDRARFPTDDQLAAEAGVAPVTRASGKHRGVTFRWACNKRFRQALTTFADNSRHASTWAAAIYARARARGCDHPHTIRILARAWVRVLWRCWQDRRPYDVTRHRAAQPLSTLQPVGG